MILLISLFEPRQTGPTKGTIVTGGCYIQSSECFILRLFVIAKMVVENRKA